MADQQISQEELAVRGIHDELKSALALAGIFERFCTTHKVQPQTVFMFWNMQRTSTQKEAELSILSEIAGVLGLAQNEGGLDSFQAMLRVFATKGTIDEAVMNMLSATEDRLFQTLASNKLLAEKISEERAKNEELLGLNKELEIRLCDLNEENKDLRKHCEYLTKSPARDEENK